LLAFILQVSLRENQIWSRLFSLNSQSSLHGNKKPKKLKREVVMNISEIAPDVYRFSIFVPEINLQFNQFLFKDDEPLLFHTGMKVSFRLSVKQ